MFMFISFQWAFVFNFFLIAHEKQTLFGISFRHIMVLTDYDTEQMKK